MPLTRQSRFNPAPAANSRHTYRLKFTDDGVGVPKDIEFEAYDAAMALVIAHKEACNRPAELWCDGHRICSIKCTSHGFWEIGTDRLIAATA